MASIVSMQCSIAIELVWEIGLFEKQLGINCTREQIGLFSNFHECCRSHEWRLEKV